VTLWAERTGVPPARGLMAFTASLDVDRRLAADDVAGSLAHLEGLARSGIVTREEAEVVAAALRRAGEELAEGTFRFAEGDEDVHTAIERRVVELAGPAGAKLHTGRSRNDQVATALRLYVRRELVRVAEGVLGLARTLSERAQEVGDAYLPGYTHLQRAQPVLLAHHLLAHGWALLRDVDRLAEAFARADVCPLGAGALAGSSLPLDPDAVAGILGFSARFENSLDAVADRDFVAEALFVLALIGVHLSRLGEEVVLFSTAEFGFYRLDDAWATGSSMLPQKKNPDVAELARGKAGRLVGHLAGLLTTLKGLPLAYNRDLQEDKEPLFDALDQTHLALDALTGLVASLGFDLERMRAAADGPEVAAVDLAEWLVARGVPFRDAHGIVAGLVRDSHARRVPLAELVEAHPALGAEALTLLEPGVAVQRRTTPGGAGPLPVRVELERFEDRRAAAMARVEELRARVQATPA